jgi:hypothetical protein
MYLDVCRFNPSAVGTADFAVSSAVAGYQTPASAGAQDTAFYYYRAESADLTQWEVGIGTWSAGASTLARTTVLFNSLGTTAKVNFSAAPQVAIVALAEGLRTKLAANLTLYVRPDGNDANSGLANTPAGAFLTLQAAVNAAMARYDSNGFTITLQLAASSTPATFAGQTLVTGSLAGGGALLIQGDTTTPGNFVLTASASPNGNGVLTALDATFSVAGVKIISTGSAADGLLVGGQSHVTIAGKCEFGACVGAQMHIIRSALLDILAPLVISGSAGFCLSLNQNSAMLIASGSAWTLSGTPNWGVFILAGLCSSVNMGSFTYAGTGTGSRFQSIQSSVVNTAGGQTTTPGSQSSFLPGNSDGTLATQGQVV